MEEFAERIHSASPVTRYAAGSVITVLVLLIRIFAGNLWGSTLPLITLYPAVFIAAWLGGFGPGLLSCLICAAADDYLNVLPTYSFSTNHYGDMVALFLFVLIGTMMVAVVDSRAKSEAQLRAAQKVERDARAAAESANRTKDLLLAIVSHDLRNPLQGILGAVQVLGNLQLPREAQQFLPIIERNARTQARLLQDLMDLSRISAGYLSLSQNYETIRTIVEFTLDSMRPQFLEKKLNVEWTKTGGEKTLFVDIDRMQQIVSNLLSNAVKFTNPGGTIRVQLDERSDSQIELAISDSGIGIHPDFLPHVFIPFHQAETGARRQGLGLGLAIVKDLVELHGGTIEARSAGPGTGSTFIVRLPVASRKEPRVARYSA
jgi:signal transduction histidine kinase